MKKIITTVVFLALSTFSAKAVDFSGLSFTAGIASNTSVWGASAREKNSNDSGTQIYDKGHSGVFADDYSSYIFEVGVGEWLSFGYEHTPDSISTPEAISNEGKTNKVTATVKFNDLNTTYAKINIPGGLYLKAGSTEVDLDIQESTNGSQYANKSTSGSVVAVGYQRLLGDSGFGLRFEGGYYEFDNVSTDNGASTATAANGGLNKIEAKNLEGASGRIALTYTFGRN